MSTSALVAALLLRLLLPAPCDGTLSSARPSELRLDLTVEHDVHSIAATDDGANEAKPLDQDEFPPARIIYPLDGTVVPLPVIINCQFAVDDSSKFIRKHGHRQLCIEIDQLYRKCVPLTSEPPQFTDLSSGNHSVNAFLVEDASSSGSGEKLLESKSVRFTVLQDQDYQEYVGMKNRKERELFGIEEDGDLLAWASEQATSTQATSCAEDDRVCSTAFRSEPPAASTEDAAKQHPPPVVLVIGVKTSVLHGFAARQAIRATWGKRKSLHANGAKMFFIGCQPVLFEDQHREQREAFIRAIEVEKRHFDDLLTDELECEDSYFTLPTKVKEFLHFAATKFPHVPYVMIADDDIYLRVDQLTQALRKHGPRTHFYAGQVWAKVVLRVAPIRDPGSKSYLSEAQYPMSDLPPFASGPHYIMSMDCAEFIATNRNKLKGLAASDDVSVGLWLLALQVHPEHLPSFEGLRVATCTEQLVAFADLTSRAIRIIHANLQVGAPFCRGFDLATWQKINQPAHRLVNERKLDFAVRVETTSDDLQITTEVTLEYGVSTKSFQFSPTQSDFEAHSAEVCRYLNKIQLFEYDCSDIAQQIHSVMVMRLNGHEGL
ncbi:hypothetical protein Gpo141_00003014 [Globisporangium polare]